MSHFGAPVYLCSKGYPNFCDMEGKAVPRYSSFMIFRVWVIVQLQCVIPTQKWMKLHFGAILIAEFLETGLEILNDF